MPFAYFRAACNLRLEGFVGTKYPTESWWLKGLFLAPSAIHGQGVFTPAAIQANTVVVRWGGNLFTEEDLKLGKVRAHTYVGIGKGLYLANPEEKPAGLDDF